ncbi:MAG: GlmL-related ornithine degradation protein [Defluviitaleaceae bacterium]|nr:GlmL-related ornithine degradation protein [Defluviitaleaceae bacterium]
MKACVLVAEIGSTTTIVNAFGGRPLAFLGQGAAATTVARGDVALGLNAAKADLARALNAENIEYDRFLATSSAAGGLCMTVHGLVYDMTVKAGQEAALGAGANIALATAGKMDEDDLAQICAAKPNLILLSGGTDYGDKDVALHNAQMLAGMANLPPVIYCGNIQNHNKIIEIFDKAGKKLYIAENVYPRLDELNIAPVRRLIHQAFEEHITSAPGMENIRRLVDGAIMPTPGAVMEAAALMHEFLGDLVVADVGGATTDIHSVAEGDEDVAAMQISPEPLAKRTVEGDLGLYVNAKKLAQAVGFDVLSKELGFDIAPIFEDYKPVPETAQQLALTTRLAYHAASRAMIRHAGQLRHSFSPRGRQTHAIGKDLTAVKYLIATGGALTRLPNAPNVLDELTKINASGNMLFPKPGMLQILKDEKYIMASLGVLSREYPEDARRLLKELITC